MNKYIQKKPFTERELRVVRGNIQRIAAKNKVTRRYVSKIINGHAPIRTRKAQAVYRDTKKLIEALKEFAG